MGFSRSDTGHGGTDLTRESSVRSVKIGSYQSDTGFPCQIEKNRSDTGFPCQNGHKQEVLDLGSTGNGKRITLQSKDQTDSVHHAKRSIQYHFDLIAILCHPVPAPK